MAKHLTLIFLSIFIYSCSTKKAVVSNTVTDFKIDSVYKEKKDSLSFRNNYIVTKELVYDMEIVPIDSTKPIVIDNKEYKNAAIKIKKSDKSSVDSTKVIVLESSDKKVEIEKESVTKDLKKEIVRKPNYLLWIGVFLILVAIFAIRRMILKFLL